MECPCPCEICGEWFDLEDGVGSERLKSPDGTTIICANCGEKEREEIEREEEICELNETIENAEYEIKCARERLAELAATLTTI